MKIYTKTQRGFSLIELLLVLGIIAALTVAAFVVYPRVQASRIASEEMNTIIMAKTTIQGLFPTGNYNGINLSLVRDAKILPSHMVQQGPTGLTLRNRWSKDSGARNVNIGGANSSGLGSGGRPGYKRFFTIAYNDVPTDICIRMAGMGVNHFDAVFINKGNNSSIGYPVINPHSANENYRELNEELIARECQGTNGRARITFMSD